MLAPVHPWEVCLYSTQIAKSYLLSRIGLHSFKKKQLTTCEIMLMLVSADRLSVPFCKECVYYVQWIT